MSPWLSSALGKLIRGGIALTKMRTGRFSSALIVSGAVLGILATGLKHALGIPSASGAAALLGGALLGGGLLCVIVTLNWFIRRRHFRWLQRQ
jgi:hypothetical protein